MPTYDYVCDACDHSFELYQSITAEAEPPAPPEKLEKFELDKAPLENSVLDTAALVADAPDARLSPQL